MGAQSSNSREPHGRACALVPLENRADCDEGILHSAWKGWRRGHEDSSWNPNLSLTSLLVQCKPASTKFSSSLRELITVFSLPFQCLSPKLSLAGEAPGLPSCQAKRSLTGEASGLPSCRAKWSLTGEAPGLPSCRRQGLINGPCTTPCTTLAARTCCNIWEG